MSREWAGRTRSEGWVMVCDRHGCSTRSEVQPTTADLPLERFASEGWFIAAVHGDRCPDCVAAEGGMDQLTSRRRAYPPLRDTDVHPGWPHRVMEQTG